MYARRELDRRVQVLDCRIVTDFRFLENVGDADRRFAKRRQRGLVSRIDVDAGGAGLDSLIRVTQRVALVPVETDAGRARLDPWQSVRVGDIPSSFQAGKTGKTVNCIDYRPRSRLRERILQAPGQSRR